MTARQSTNQTPTLEVCSRCRDTSEGELAVRLCSSYGLVPDEWQAYVLRKWLLKRSNGRYASGTVCLSVPRQNGKNAALVMYELFALAVQGRQILHTAHQVKTAREAFRVLASIFSDSRFPELAGAVRHIRYANGQEMVELLNGGRISFIARNANSGRGFTADTVVCDEAQDLEDEEMEVLRPTLTAAPSGNPLFIMTGTPTPPSSHGEVFRRTRKNAIEGAGRITWLEWGIDNLEHVEDRAVWARVNPGYGLRVSREILEDDYASMSTDGFVREHLGWWNPNTENFNSIFKAADWERCKVEKAPTTEDEVVAFGIKFSPDGSVVSLCAAAKQNTTTFVDCVFIEPNNGKSIQTLASWVFERQDRVSEVVLDGKSGAPTLMQKLNAMGIRRGLVRVVPWAAMIAACDLFKNGIEEHSIKHAGQKSLTDSVLAVQKRNIGRQGGWGFMSGRYDCTPAEAAALAVWAANTTKKARAGSRAGGCRVL